MPTSGLSENTLCCGWGKRQRYQVKRWANIAKDVPLTVMREREREREGKRVHKRKCISTHTHTYT